MKPIEFTKKGKRGLAKMYHNIGETEEGYDDPNLLTYYTSEEAAAVAIKKEGFSRNQQRYAITKNKVEVGKKKTYECDTFGCPKIVRFTTNYAYRDANQQRLYNIDVSGTHIESCDAAVNAKKRVKKIALKEAVNENTDRSNTKIVE